MSWTDYDIVGSYNNQRVLSIDSERTVNLFEYIDSKGKKRKSLLPTSGIVDTGLDFDTIQGGFRAHFIFKNLVGGVDTGLTAQYAVIGQYFVKITGVPGSYTYQALNGPSTLLSNISGYVGIDANTYQIMLVDGEKGWIYDIYDNSFVQITDPEFPPRPIDVCYLDGYFVVAEGLSNRFQLSQFNQGLVWSGSGNVVVTMPVATANTLEILTGTTLFRTGVQIKFNTDGGGTLPTGLIAGKTYYAVRLNATQIQVALTPEDARAIPNPVVVSITATTGTAPVNITNTGELQQAQITSHPGTIVACRTLHRRLFLFSQNFTEVWENYGSNVFGGANLPFRRNNSLLIEYGTPAIGSIQVGFDMMFFLSQDRDGLGAVQKVIGTQALPVSNRALDFELARYAATPVSEFPPGTPAGTTGVQDARGILIKENGLIFYRLNFTLKNHTFVYNDSMSNPGVEEERRWHEEEILNGDRHPAQTHAFYNGVNYYGDYQLPFLYLVDPAISTNNGQTIRRMRIGRPQVPDTYQRLRMDRFHLDVVQGSIEEVQIGSLEINLLTELGIEMLTEYGVPILTENSQGVIDNTSPQVYLSMSKDGGQSFGNELIAPMGKIGQRTFRTVWRKLGTIPRGQAFVPKIEFYNRIPFVILGASWVFEVMPE